MNLREWRRYRSYVFLVPLFAVAIFYQVTYSIVSLLVAAHATTVPSRPFGTEGQIVTAVDPEIANAGLHPGDRVLTINGQPFISNRVLMEQIRTTGRGERLMLSVIPSGQRSPRLVQVPPRFWDDLPATLWRWIDVVILSSVMLLCVLAGVYVAGVLPNDIRAFTVFGLMLATSQLLSIVSWYNFPRPLWAFADALHMVGVGSWSVWLVLFALYFPHRFDWDRKRPWLKWIVLLPWLLLKILQIAAEIGDYYSFDSITPIRKIVDAPVVNHGGLTLAALAVFFLSIAARMWIGEDPDSRRRLRLLLLGSLTGLLPGLGLILYEYLTAKNEFRKIPESIIIVVSLLFCLFPLTLAYVVVAERTMRLRMVVRQGFRYTIAKGGLRLFILLISVGLYSLLSNYVFGLNLSTTAKIIITVAFIVSMSFLIRKTRTRLVLWLDRRFFREAYNAELLLQDLDERVQSIVSEQELLDTVARRIAETLHIPRLAILLNEGQGAFHPVYCLGFECGPHLNLPERSKTIDLVRTSKHPAPIYFERRDNWIHDTSNTERNVLKTMDTEILLPVGYKEKLLGLFSLGPKLSEEPYSSSDIQLLRSVALHTGLALENSRLATAIAKEMAQRERLNREIEIAREVQQRLFPQRLPCLSGIDYFGACRPALAVGGDYYDFLTLANGDLGIAIGDVSGKGIAAALLMASLQAFLRGQAMMNQGDLARLMTNVNQLIYETTPINRYATFFYGQINLGSRTFTYVNAGHNAPIILRRTNNGPVHVIRLETGGPVVGLLPKAPYQQGTVILEPGDVFVGFTDGISEAMNSRDEEWGEDRLIPAIAKNADQSAAAIIPAIMTEADRFASGAPQHDDMTLVVVKVLA